MARPNKDKKPEPMDRHAFQKLVMNEVIATRSMLAKRFLDSDPRRDIDAECGYPQEISLEQCQFMYDRESLATRVINIFPDDCWAMDPEIFESHEKKDTPFSLTWEELNEEHNIVSMLHRVDQQSGIGHFGVLLLGLDDGLPLNEPASGLDLRTGLADPKGRKHKLIYLRPFNEILARIMRFEMDPTSPRYGLPIEYMLKFIDMTITGQTSSSGGAMLSEQIPVHWTRVLHFADNRTSSEVFGTPRIQNVYNRIYDMRKLLSGSAEMFWKGAFPGYSFEVPHEILGEVELDPVSLRQEFERYSNGLQRYLALKGVVAKSLAPQAVSPTGHLDAQISAIAMAIGCPGRIFMGSEEGRLASNQDTRTWNKKIKKRQLRYINPYMLKPTVERFQAFKMLPTIKKYYKQWPDLNAPTDEDLADVAVKRTNALGTFVSMGVASVFEFEQFLTRILGFSDEEAVAIIKSQKPVPPENMKILKLSQSTQDKTAQPPKDRKKSGEGKGGGK